MDEEIRLQAVKRFNNLDLENDAEMQEIVELASAVANVPYALVTLLDEDTQYLKVRKGVTETTVPRNISFCTYAIEQDTLMLVPDSEKDPRFAENPLVVGAPGIRFYAGMPLTTREGQKLGTLCVFDLETHILSDHQQTVIRILANQVIKIMEIRIAKEMLKEKQRELAEQRQINNEANIRIRSFFESSTNFHVLLGKNCEVIDYNKTAYKFIKTVYQTKLLRGDDFVKYIHPSFTATFIEKYNLGLQGVKSLEEGSTEYEQMGVFYWEAYFEPAFDDDNQIIGMSYLIRNVTERKIKEQKIIAQNRSLLEVAHIQAHEFRGPLTTIMGLMNLIKEDDYQAPVEYMELMEKAVNTLDDKIKQIVNNVDQIVVGNGIADY